VIVVLAVTVETGATVVPVVKAATVIADRAAKAEATEVRVATAKAETRGRLPSSLRHSCATTRNKP
jgi:hypothetical protein